MTQHWFAIYVSNSIFCVTFYKYITPVLFTVFNPSKPDTVNITRFKIFVLFKKKTIIAPTPHDKLNYKYFCHFFELCSTRWQCARKRNTAVHRATTSLSATRLTQSFVLGNNAALHTALVFVTIHAGVVICSSIWH